MDINILDLEFTIEFVIEHRSKLGDTILDACPTDDVWTMMFVPCTQSGPELNCVPDSICSVCCVTKSSL